MIDRWDEVRLDFGDAIARLRSLARDDDSIPGACDRLVQLAERAADILRDVREGARASRRNSLTPAAVHDA